MKKYLFAIACVFVLVQSAEALGHSYGAIAYSSATGRYGWSTGQWNLGTAEWNARANCGAYDCRTAVWINSGCAAIAVGWNNRSVYGYGYAPLLYTAHANALSSCSLADYNCQVLAHICTN